MSAAPGSVSAKSGPLAEEFAFVEEPLPLTREPGTWPDIVQGVRRLERDIAELKEDADGGKRKMILNLIENVMDNLDRALLPADTGADDGSLWLKRLRQARTLAQKVLTREGVSPLDLVSAPPGVVSVLDTVPSDTVPAGEIVEVVVRGYLWNGSILRRAVVRVSGGPAPSGDRPVSSEGAQSNG